MSYRTKLLLSIVSVVMIVMTGAMVVLASVLNRQVKNATRRATMQVQAQLQDSITTVTSRLSAEAKLLADSAGMRSVIQTDTVTTNEYLGRLSSLGSASWLCIVTPKGLVLGKTAGTPSGVEKHLDRSGEPQRSRLDSQLHTYGNQTSVLHRQPIMVGEYVQGHLIVGKNLDSAWLSKLARGSGTELAIEINGVRTAASMESLLEDPKLPARFETGRLDLTPPGGSPQIQLVTLLDRDQVAAGYLAIQNWLLVLTLGGVGLSCGVAFVIASRTTRPLQHLMTAASTLEQGRWPEPFHSTRMDEFGVLQNAFDQMTAALHKQHDKLVSMLDIDPLTECFNFRKFSTVIENGWQDPTSHLALIDLDGFSEFNSHHGPAAGDQVLITLAKTIAAAQPNAILCRYQGNQFLAMWSTASAQADCDAWRQRIALELPVTVSIGYCGKTGETSDLRVALMATELALAQAKNGGRDQARAFGGFQTDSGIEALSFLKQSSYAAVSALAEAVDAKDPYTHGHSRRVAEYARDLAAFAGFTPAIVNLAYVSGTLHDVGKIGVPDSILQKAGHLTDEEFQQIQLHPALGEKIVAQIPELIDTLPGIRHHHERYDGKGYPDQLAGEEIPVVARLLAIADTFDAMTSDRPYRKGLPLSKALAIIAENGGTQFDPRLAEQFIELWANRDTLERAA